MASNGVVAEPDLPVRLGSCRLEARLGGGAFGSVFRASTVEATPYAPAGGAVAVKVLERLSPGDRRRFLREAELGKKVRHPTVVRTFDVGAGLFGGRECPYLVMELVRGRTLRQLMDQLGCVPESLLRGLALQIAAALEAVHQAGAVHRDLKPTNVLITGDYQVKLSDLGVAGLVDPSHRLTDTGAFVGTLSYAAPEQLRSRSITAAADLYALGVVLFEAATGVQPFEAESLAGVVARHLNEVPPRVGELRPELGPFFEAVVAELVEKNPADRFASAADLAEVLRSGEASTWWLAKDRLRRATGPRRRHRRRPAEPGMVFVGRGDELRDLEAAWDRCRGGDGRLVLIRGEAGIGKSRLLEELVLRLERRTDDFHLLYGSDSPGSRYGTGSLARAILDHLGEAGLELEIAGLIPRLAGLAPGFAALLTGLPAPAGAEPVPQDAVATLFGHLLRAWAERKAVLWIAEDLHFAGAETRELTLALAHAAKRLRAMLVVTCRPEVEDRRIEALEKACDLRIDLGRLPAAAAQSLLERALGLRGPSRLARRIAERADGNPLFLAEMIRETRNATRSPDESAIVPTIPVSVWDLLEARLRSLDPTDRSLLGVGAVQGFRFDPALLAEVRGLHLLEVLERLTGIERGAGIVRGTEQGFRFDHHLMQELVYGGLSPSLREAYHRKLAEAMERTRGPGSGGVDGETAAALCEHFLKGGDRSSGIHYSIAALEHLARQYRSEELLDLAELVLTSAPEDELLRCDVRLMQAECFFRLGRRDDHAAAAGEALALADSGAAPDRAARARLTQGRALVDSGPAAYEVLEDAIGRARAAGDRHTEARAMVHLGNAHLLGGDFRTSLELYGRQLRLCEELGDREGMAEACCFLGTVHLGLDRPAEARGHLDRGIAICREIGLAGLEAQAHADLALSWSHVGDLARARQGYERSLALCQEAPYLQVELLALGNFMSLRLLEGDLEHAEELLGLLDERNAISRSPFYEVYARLGRASLAHGRSQIEEARRLFHQARDQAREIAALYGLVEVLIALGRLELFSGSADRCRSSLGEALKVAAELGVESHAVVIRSYLAALGDVAPNEIEVPENLPVPLRAESHLALHCAGAGDGHLARCLLDLHHLSAHLDGRGRQGFWTRNPVAKAALDQGGGDERFSSEPRPSVRQAADRRSPAPDGVGCPASGPEPDPDPGLRTGGGRQR